MRHPFRFSLAGGICLLLGTLLTACSLQPPPVSQVASTNSQPASTEASTAVPAFTPTQVSSPTLTDTPLPTGTATATLIPTNPPTLTSTATPSTPRLTVLQQSHCRYGPGKAYLHAADLYPGEIASLDGKSASGSWLWIKPDKINYHCWVSKSLVETAGDLSALPFIPTNLPMSVAGLYDPPEKVWAERDGDEVTVYWSDVWMTEDDDRDYLIEAFICQKGGLVFYAVWTDKPRYIFNDERKGCSQPSSGKLYAVEKHGYLQSVEIPWP